MEVLTKIRDYWDKRARDYDRAPGHSGFEEEWKKFLSGKLSSESKILDVGTGTGFIALLLAELGYEVVGV
ncbi:MAG: methyltransferase type 11, partial [Archaeoglobaceae archaeon]